MNILVDGRAFVKTSAGISTFLQGSLEAWALQSPKNTFFLALPQVRDSSLNELVLPDNVIWVVSQKRIFKWLPNLFWLLITMPILSIKYHIDIYYTPVPCIPFFVCKRIKKIIVVHDVVNIEYKETMEWTNRIATKLFFIRSIQKADVIWTNSYYTKACVEKYFPVRKCRRIFVGCSVNRKIYHRMTIHENEWNHISNKYGIDNRFILFVGSLEPRKNLTFLLSLMPEVWKANRIPLLVVGAKGWKKTGISEIINSQDYPKEAVVFCGYVSNYELSILYNKATCFISTSLNEGFGMPQLEAFLCGCPVITANNSAMSEVAEGKSGSRLVDGYDKNCWVKVINDFICHPERTNPGEFIDYDWNMILQNFLFEIFPV